MIKDNSENFGLQQVLFKNLRELLEVKKNVMMHGGDGMKGHVDTDAKGFNRFVME
jgi:hypothetical protein